MLYSECVSVYSVIQHTLRMRRILLLLVARPALQIFSTLSHTPHDISEKVFDLKMCLDFL
jgi:hypothetical protein